MGVRQRIDRDIAELSEALKKKAVLPPGAGGFPNRLFVQDVVEDEADRDFIINAIEEQHPQRRVIHTKLLYSYSLMRLLNPHPFIDNRENFIVILTFARHTLEGKPYMIAMYSERPLIKHSWEFNTGKGFVASVTNRRVFRLNKSKNATLTEYNEYFIIFGKGEVMFQINHEEVKFNIGHNHRSLDTKDEKTPMVFTGTTEEKEQFINYEIFQVALGEQPI
jgi:hypothetical protein